MYMRKKINKKLLELTYSMCDGWFATLIHIAIGTPQNINIHKDSVYSQTRVTHATATTTSVCTFSQVHTLK